MSQDLVEYASKYGDSDLQRLGLFIEMPYLRNEKDVGPKRNKSMEAKRYWTNAGSSYPKNGTQDGYFNSEFVRVFDGEYKSRSNERKDDRPKDIFVPAGPGKKHSSPGDYWGCFIRDGEWPEHFSPIKKQVKRDKDEKIPPNPITNPGKKGGPGYIDITLGPYPQHIDEPPLKRKTKDAQETPSRPMYSGWRNPGYFDDSPYKSVGADGPTYVKPKERIVEQKTIFVPTGPGKLRGGCFDGGFSHWPEHVKDLYNPKPKKTKTESRIFRTPGLVPKTLFTKSTLENTTFAVNAMNWKEYTPKYVQYL